MKLHSWSGLRNSWIHVVKCCQGSSSFHPAFLWNFLPASLALQDKEDIFVNGWNINPGKGSYWPTVVMCQPQPITAAKAMCCSDWLGLSHIPLRRLGIGVGSAPPKHRQRGRVVGITRGWYEKRGEDAVLVKTTDVHCTISCHGSSFLEWLDVWEFQSPAFPRQETLRWAIRCAWLLQRALGTTSGRKWGKLRWSEGGVVLSSSHNSSLSPAHRVL